MDQCELKWMKLIQNRSNFHHKVFFGHGRAINSLGYGRIMNIFGHDRAINIFGYWKAILGYGTFLFGSNLDFGQL